VILFLLIVFKIISKLLVIKRTNEVLLSKVPNCRHLIDKTFGKLQQKSRYQKNFYQQGLSFFLSKGISREDFVADSRFP
jgi:hypothetical protein